MSTPTYRRISSPVMRKSPSNLPVRCPTPPVGSYEVTTFILLYLASSSRVRFAGFLNLLLWYLLPRLLFAIPVVIAASCCRTLTSTRLSMKTCLLRISVQERMTFDLATWDSSSSALLLTIVVFEHLGLTDLLVVLLRQTAWPNQDTFQADVARHLPSSEKRKSHPLHPLSSSMRLTPCVDFLTTNGSLWLLYSRNVIF